MVELDKIPDANEEYSHSFRYGTLPFRLQENFQYSHVWMLG